MPAGDPAGYLPNVKRARAKRGDRIYKTRVKRGSKLVDIPVSGAGAVPKPSSPSANKFVQQVRAAKRSGKPGTGIKGAAVVGTSARKVNPRSPSGGVGGAEVEQTQYARGNRRWNVWFSGGRRHVRSFTVRSKRGLH